jgi:hypothetical protein
MLNGSHESCRDIASGCMRFGLTQGYIRVMTQRIARTDQSRSRVRTCLPGSATSSSLQRQLNLLMLNPQEIEPMLETWTCSETC